MPIPLKIKKFLDRAGVKYEEISHKTVYTAYDKSATLKEKLNVFAKTLIVRTGKEVFLVLIPANRNLDFKGFKKPAGFVTEKWMKENIKGVKLGAVAPFGSIWKMQTYIDKNLLKLKKIIINSGGYENSIKISPKELKKANPDAIFGNYSKAKK